MTQNIEIHYIVDKETKGTICFRPKDDTVIGNATIYLPKPVLKAYGIDPEKGFYMVIRSR
ncbi:MAG: hypothetical protein AB1796_08625 [Bacillota bacterium]